MEVKLRDHCKQFAKEEEILRQGEASRGEEAAASAAVKWQTKAENEESCRRVAEQEAEQWKQEVEKWKQMAEQWKQEAEKQTAENERLRKEKEQATEEETAGEENQRQKQGVQVADSVDGQLPFEGSRLDEALDIAEAEYYDLSMLPWTWVLFFLVCIICGTGLHTWLLRLLPGIEWNDDSSVITDAFDSLANMSSLMEGLQASFAESPAMRELSSEGSPLMDALRQWGGGAKVDDIMAQFPGGSSV